MSDTRVLAGVLELNCGKTYGRQVRTSGKEGRLLYGIRHGYTDLPPVKAPYDLRSQHGNGTCSRYVKDKYVLFSLPGVAEPGDVVQRPEAIITETLGDVDDIDAFSAFKAYGCGLKMSSCWQKPLSTVRGNAKEAEIVKSANQLVIDDNMDKENANDVMTIDPPGCKDMDDGVGIVPLGGGTYKVTIAITSVPTFLVASGVTSEQLRGTMANTCSLYMAGRVVNMLPKRFAENVCSLVEGTQRPALCMTFVWDEGAMTADELSLSIRRANVTKNYAYDTEEMLADPAYTMLHRCVESMSQHWKRYDACPNIRDSHDVIAYLMTLMNHYTMEWLVTREQPCVYRVNRKKDIGDLPNDLHHLRNKIGNHAGEYCTHDDVAEYKRDCGDGNDVVVWCHITSPMRRLADLTNMMTVSSYLHPEVYDGLSSFRGFCLTMVRRMSEEYKSSRRLSLDCDLFAIAKGYSGDPDMLNRVFNAVVIQVQADATVVYIDELSRFFNCDIRVVGDIPVEVYRRVRCRIVAFEEGHTIYEKVRVVCVEN